MTPVGVVVLSALTGGVLMAAVVLLSRVWWERPRLIRGDDGRWHAARRLDGPR